MKTSSSPRRLQRSLLKDTRGSNLTEYIMLLGLVAIVSVGAVRAFGQSVKDQINKAASEVRGISGQKN